MGNHLVFALDIGTRSVVGLVGKSSSSGLEIIAYEREEHYTRAMLDGQIHDVPEVAAVIAKVKSRLEAACGSVRQVAVAAAGRSLCTVKARAEIDASTRGALTQQDERALELAAVQSAQKQLAAGHAVTDPTSYYCVGYSVTGFLLDELKLTSLVGQRGKLAAIDVIVTFLPRQVIDSMQSALQAVDLEMATLTLEPIAAINVLIPPTMRHLNLALVDVGAGTSDVAITKNGSVIAYGMVPSAGDEITETLSQQYLLDFNVAETVKRQVQKTKKVSFRDVLGTVHKVDSARIIDSMKTSIANLAQDISREILALNGTAPQAVLLVGGGSLTPLLPEALAQALDIQSGRVAIRRPENVDGIREIPIALRQPDGVTPLGILKVASGNNLNFVDVYVNDHSLRLFNLGALTVADALLAAGIEVRSLYGKPGLGLTVSINGATRFLPGTLGKPGKIERNGQPSNFSDPLSPGDVLRVEKGANGDSPSLRLSEAEPLPAPVLLTFNHTPVAVPPQLTINGKPVNADAILSDRDEVECRSPKTIGEVLHALSFQAPSRQFHYVINGSEREFSVHPLYLLNGRDASLDTDIEPEDSLEIIPAKHPTVAEVLGLSKDPGDHVSFQFNGKQFLAPMRRVKLMLDGKPTTVDAVAPDNSRIDCAIVDSRPTVSDALLASGFRPDSLPPGSRACVLLNGQSTEYTAFIKNGDTLEIAVQRNE